MPRSSNVRQSHYCSRIYSLDASKLHSASLFYAPCRAAAENASFFHDHKQPPRDALDVNSWLTSGSKVSTPPVAIVPTAIGYVNREVVADAIGVWRATAAGSGHSAFFALAARLRSAGLPMLEIERRLMEEAEHAHSPNERRHEIADVVASLNK